MIKFKKRKTNKKRKTKAKWLHSTHAWVLMYGFFYMILILLYCLPRLLCEFIPISYMNHIYAGFSFPIDIFSWGLVAVMSGYSGIDRAAMATKSSMMQIGKADMGNPQHLQSVIKIMFVILLEAMSLHFFFGNDKEINGVLYKGINVPLEAISTAFVSTVSIYVMGNKSIRLTQNLDRTKDTQNWADEKSEVKVGGEIKPEE